MDSFLALPRRKTLLFVFVVKGMVTVILSWECTFLPFSMFGNYLDRLKWPGKSSLAWVVAWT